MVLTPSIIALIGGSFLVCAFCIYASGIGAQILHWWDISSGSERQLRLERKTYLISTILNYVFLFQLFSLFLFVYTADHLHGLFVGAMCAAGSLNVNEYGYPTLIVKLATFSLCGIWLIVNYTDNRGFDYPCIRHKYRLLLGITAAIVFESLLQTAYFLNMNPNVITSCCGTLFSENVETIAGDMAGMPSRFAKIVFYLGVILTGRAGIHFLVTGQGARLFSYAGTFLYVFSMAAVISFISVYFYELPTHHCPFCLLQREYRFIGYPLYVSLFVAGITGVGVGTIDRLRPAVSLRSVIPAIQRKLCITSLIGYAVFVIIATYPMIFTDFKLEGY